MVDERTVVALPEKSLPPRVASMREVGLVVVERSVGLKMLVETPEVIDQEDLNSQLYVPFFSITPLIENRATTFIIYIFTWVLQMDNCSFLNCKSSYNRWFWTVIR